MDITVIDIVDETDGGAIVTFEMDEEAKEAFVKYALMDILTKAADEAIELYG